MKQKTLLLLKHPVVSGSSIVLVGSFLVNIINWIFNLLIGGRHLLSSADYGTYSTLISILGLLSVFQVSFTSIFAKFSAQYVANNNKDNLQALVYSGGKFIFLFSTAVLVFLVILLVPVANFLHIYDIRLMLLIYLTIYFSLLSSLPIGILQGKLHFLRIVLFNASVTLIKLVLGLILIFLGIKILGVMFAVFISSLVPFLYIMYTLYVQHRATGSNEIDTSVFFNDFKKYSLKFFIATFGITVFTSADIILVRHFFNAETSGHYAALSIMGKSIFYLTSPIYYAFFPLIVQKNERNENVIGTLAITGGIILGLSSCLSFIYFFFPKLILQIFFPAKEYSVLAPYLGLYSLFILIFSLVMLFNNFLLSIGKTNIYIINAIGACLLILSVYQYHTDLYDITNVLIVISFLLLISHLLYFAYEKRK